MFCGIWVVSSVAERNPDPPHRLSPERDHHPPLISVLHLAINLLFPFNTLSQSVKWHLNGFEIDKHNRYHWQPLVLYSSLPIDPVIAMHCCDSSLELDNSCQSRIVIFKRKTRQISKVYFQKFIFEWVYFSERYFLKCILQKLSIACF